jgi:hypothetical protein
MKSTSSITITTALAALVTFAYLSFSGVSDARIEHGAKGKHKHAVHKLAVKHRSIPSQTLVEPGAEEALGEKSYEDHTTGTIPTGLSTMWYNSDHALANSGHDGILSATSPIDTIASLGPDSWGNFQGAINQGRTRALLVSSASNSTFFAGCVSGGLWKSTNAGASWTPVNDTAASLNVSCITQSPFSSNVIYYGTGEVVGRTERLGGNGVFKSTDGGITFQQLSATTNFGLGSVIEYDKADSLTVYYGTLDSGLQRTTNGGSNWSMAAGTAGDVCDIITFPNSGFNDNVLIAKYDSGLYRSTNGKTAPFTKVSSSAFPALGNFTGIKLAQCKNFPNVVYAAFDASASGGAWWNGNITAFCKSTDGGVTWTARTPPPGNYYGDWGVMMGIDPLDTNTLLVDGSVGGNYSTNGGVSWNVAVFPRHYDRHVIAPLNLGSHAFIEGTDGGVEHGNWDSLGGGTFAVWHIDSNYQTMLFLGGDFASSGRRCVGGAEDNGSWRISPSDINGVSVDGGDGVLAYISQQDSNLAYTENENEVDRFRSLWSGMYPSNTKIAPTTAQDTEGVPDWYYHYWMNYADGKQLYLSTAKGLWRSLDTGNNWTRLNTTNITGILKLGCTNAANPSVYFDGHDAMGNGHFYRIDNAATFSPGTPVDLSASIPYGNDHCGEITPSPSNSSELYIGVISTTSSHRAWKVMNANTATPTWVNISGTPGAGGLPSYVPVYQIQVDPDDTTSLVAATYYGLYFSRDMGVNWYKDSRIPNVEINQMKLRASDRKLFLFTYGRGAWYCSLKPNGGLKPVTTASSSTEISDKLEFSLYPNPAMEKLTVSPQQELSSSARITIYSSDGRTISVSAWNPTGEVNISSLPSGDYFLQIQDGDRIAKGKFVKE